MINCEVQNKVVPIRFSNKQIEKLNEVAKKLNIGVSTLIRNLSLSNLDLMDIDLMDKTDIKSIENFKTAYNDMLFNKLIGKKRENKE